jgi:glycosyltransferase involved in cell wall biosynthesis
MNSTVAPSKSSMKHSIPFAIIAPCYNEKSVIIRFLEELEAVLYQTGQKFIIVIIDDASTDETINDLQSFKFSTENFDFRIIRLIYNAGHQEAIRQGLIFIKNTYSDLSGVFIMDSDGEDDPVAILDAVGIKNFDVVFFERAKRKEGLIFKAGYFFYKVLFKIITGRKITFGNYSLLSYRALKNIAGQNFFHFAAFLSKQKLDIQKIKYDRRERFGGNSKMNYNGLIIHGLKAIIEYSEELLIFLIKSFVVVCLFILVTAVVLIYKKFFSQEAILGWTSTIGIGLIIIGILISTTIAINLMLLYIKNFLRQEKVDFEILK